MTHRPAADDGAALVHADDLDSGAVELGLEPERKLVDAQPCRLGSPRDLERVGVEHIARTRSEVVVVPVRDEHHVALAHVSGRDCGDVGLPNHGSSSTTLPPGVRSSDA